MTESEFLTINPTNYGTGTCLIFYAQDLNQNESEANNTAYPLYSNPDSYPSSSGYTIHDIIGMSVPFNSINGIDVSATSTNVETITFNVPSPDPNNQNNNLPVNQVRADVVSIQQQSTWVYYKVENARILNPLVTGSEAPFATDGVPLWSQSADVAGVTSSKYTYGSTASAEGPQSESLFIFNSYVDDTFFQAEENPLQNNATVLRRSAHLMESRKETLKPTVIGGSYPPNLPAIRENIARPAAVPDSNFTSIGFRRGRYDGTKLTASYINTQFADDADGEIPALNLIEFLATTHSFSSSIDDITSQSVDNRGDVQRLYFNPRTDYLTDNTSSGTAPYTSSIILEGVDVPVIADTVYTDVGNKVAKVTNKLIVFTAEADNGAKGVRTTNEGYVIRIN